MLPASHSILSRTACTGFNSPSGIELALHLVDIEASGRWTLRFNIAAAAADAEWSGPGGFAG